MHAETADTPTSLSQTRTRSILAGTRMGLTIFWCLSAGAPEHLVQIVTGYAEAGNALVTSGVNKLIFVGSTEIGKKVMQAAAQNLTPVVLELGGKDAFIICDDANLAEVTCFPSFDMHAHICPFIPSFSLFPFLCPFLPATPLFMSSCMHFVIAVLPSLMHSHNLSCPSLMLNRKVLAHAVHWHKLHCITSFCFDTYRKLLQTDVLNCQDNKQLMHEYMHSSTPPRLHSLQTIPTAMKGAFFSCGQNCAGAERFFVQEAVYDSFVNQVAEVTKKMRQGPALGGGTVDCGAMCMPGLAEKVADLVGDAVQHGAKVHLHLPYQKKQQQSLLRLLAIMTGHKGLLRRQL